MKTFSIPLALPALCLILGTSACTADADKPGNTVSTKTEPEASENPTSKPEAEPSDPKAQLATFAGGCFWCTEGVFERVPGVLEVVSGYTGGTDPKPSYEKVCSPAMKGTLDNHAEAIQVKFDPGQVSYQELLAYFWKSHDPTTLNRQGADSGTQYRSEIFYHDEDQKKLAEEAKQLLDESDAFRDPIVTRITPAATFHVAESYHQDYFENNPADRYCNFILVPKLDKIFKDWRKQRP